MTDPLSVAATLQESGQEVVKITRHGAEPPFLVDHFTWTIKIDVSMKSRCPFIVTPQEKKKLRAAPLHAKKPPFFVSNAKNAVFFPSFVVYFSPGAQQVHMGKLSVLYEHRWLRNNRFESCFHGNFLLRNQKLVPEALRHGVWDVISDTAFSSILWGRPIRMNVLAWFIAAEQNSKNRDYYQRLCAEECLPGVFNICRFF